MISKTLMSKMIVIAVVVIGIFFVMMMPTKAYRLTYEFIPGEEFTYEYKFETLSCGEQRTIWEEQATTQVSKIDKGQITLNTVAALRCDNYYWLENIAYSHVITENGKVASRESDNENRSRRSWGWWQPFLVPIEYPQEALSMGEELMKSYTVEENVGTISVNLSAPGRETSVEFRVEERTILTKREKITTSAGSFDCLVLQRILSIENLSPMPENVSIASPRTKTFWIDANRHFPIKIIENWVSKGLPCVEIVPSENLPPTIENMIVWIVSNLPGGNMIAIENEENSNNLGDNLQKTLITIELIDHKLPS